MNTRRLLLSVILLSLAGCSSRAVTPPAAPVTQNKTEAPFDTPTALAQKAGSYSDEMEKLIQSRMAKPRESKVQWIEPGKAQTASAQPSAGPSAPSSAPPSALAQTTDHANQAVDATKLTPPSATPVKPLEAAPLDARTARQVSLVSGAVLGSSINEVPAIVPEGEEGIGGAIAGNSPDAGSASVARRARDNPLDISAQLDLQMLKFAQGETVPQVNSMSSLPSDDRELLAIVMDGMSNFRSGLRADANQLLSHKVKPLLDMADRLRGSAELSMPTIALCKHVNSFGVYEPIEPARFAAGREQSVLVYCEVQNFASVYNDAKKWETRLQMEIVLYTETGMPAWQGKPGTIVDQPSSRRHDFFVTKLMKIPANLPIGRYLLKVTLTDQIAKRVSEATMTVQVVAE